ncbi:MAG: hypothetical protein IKR75_05020 [Fibrobacter sp.]|jgi:hypothetical protein|uniref:hypothetical protein n=1 Tax=uncultured Fibrobacter sp. TaxID=261512 RepID=UPI0025F21BE3|nr:hypothetical protein [uncultured Fibrobacter sp.]MBQ1824315.1 hypothetical protein [Fibrobacter sp.]MBR6317769.1 hypothetical protein [Fibrobacter sp.]
MMRLIKFLIFASALFLGIWACSQDDDGPLDLTSSNEVFSGRGFLGSAELDSGRMIFLVGDTLYLHMDSIWTFSNCALRKIGMDMSVEDTALILKPYFDIQVTGEDCATPLFRPDTTIGYIVSEKTLKGISVIRVKNEQDSVLDTIFVRKGSIGRDTFRIYVDSLFDSVHSLPLRTKGSPSVLRVLDSITPQIFIWRTMGTHCSLRIDNCDSVVSDTLFPSYWRLGDTTLVPVRTACADSDLIYCHSNRWENDSTDLGKLQERPDTIWHTSTYYMEKISECGSVDRYSRSSFIAGDEIVVMRDLFERDESETLCSPSTRKDLYVYDLGRNHYVADTVDVDSLVKIWKSAKVVKKKK